MPPGNWNDSTDRQLLLIMIHLAAPQLPKWDKVAELMGDSFTAEAVRQHFQKLRKASVAQFGALNDSKNGAQTPTTTPRKPKATHIRETPTRLDRKRKTMPGHDGEKDDEEVSPFKKAVKVEKVEDVEEDELNPFR